MEDCEWGSKEGEGMKWNRLSNNVGLMSLKNTVSMIGPLIIWPYITRVLEVENVGKITFGESVIGYFILLSGLGIANYAIREASAYREDRERLSQFISDIFSINLIASAGSYLLLGICCVAVNSFYANRYLLLIYSSNILINVLSMNWLFLIEEDYLYLTVRTVVRELATMNLR